MAYNVAAKVSINEKMRVEGFDEFVSIIWEEGKCDVAQQPGITRQSAGELYA